MADDEDDVMFEFESDGDYYQDDSAADEQEILLENAFYEAQDLQLSHPKEALKLFHEIVDKDETAATDSGRLWLFKALSNVVLLHIRLGNLDSAAATYRRLLEQLQHAPRNEIADAISAVLEAATAETEAAASRVQKTQQQQQQQQEQQEEEQKQQQQQQEEKQEEQQKQQEEEEEEGERQAEQQEREQQEKQQQQQQEKQQEKQKEQEEKQQEKEEKQQELVTHRQRRVCEEGGDGDVDVGRGLLEGEEAATLYAAARSSSRGRVEEFAAEEETEEASFLSGSGAATDEAAAARQVVTARAAAAAAGSLPAVVCEAAAAAASAEREREGKGREEAEERKAAAAVPGGPGGEYGEGKDKRAATQAAAARGAAGERGEGKEDSDAAAPVGKAAAAAVTVSKSHVTEGCAAAIAEETERMTKLEDMFTQTLHALRKHNVKRLWGRTCCRLVRLYIHRGNYKKAQELLEELRVSCQDEQQQETAAAGAAAGAEGVGEENGSATRGEREELLLQQQDSGRQQLLLEYFALQMTLSLAREETASLKTLYQEALLLIRSGADPRSTALIREIGGKVNMKEKQWRAAAQDFAEAFKNYADVGKMAEAKTMLQYLVLANLLSQSKINFFESREAKAFLDDPAVAAMHALSLACEKEDIIEAYELLTDPRHGLVTDPYIGLYTNDLLENLRLQALPRVVAPYSCVTLQFLQDQLKSKKAEVVCCLSHAVGSGALKGFIDDVEGTFCCTTEDEEEWSGSGDSYSGQEILLGSAAVPKQRHRMPQQQTKTRTVGLQKAEDVWLEAAKLLIAKLNRLTVR